MKSHSLVADHESQGLAARIGRVLADRIVEGTLKPGDRIGQDAVAAEFGSSHVPVREAFRLLEGQGLVVSEPRRGIRVAAIDAASVTEVAAMRAVLESLALRHAAPFIDDAFLARIVAIVDEGARAGTLAESEALNRAFHRALVERCGMPRLLSTIDSLHQASARFLLAIWRDLDWQVRSDREHAEIVGALRMCSIDNACTVLEAHIVEAGRALIAALSY